jgi:hypothetical protein
VLRIGPPGRCTALVLRRHSRLSLSPLRPTSLCPRSARHPSRRAVFFSRTPGLFGKGRRRIFESAAGRCERLHSADVVENRTDFGIFERAPQRGINHAAYPATCSAMRAQRNLGFHLSASFLCRKPQFNEPPEGLRPRRQVFLRTSTTRLRVSCPTSRTSELSRAGARGCDVRTFTTGWPAPRRRSACRTADVLALKSHNLDATIFWFRAPNFGDPAPAASGVTTMSFSAPHIRAKLVSPAHALIQSQSVHPARSAALQCRQ